MEVKEDKRERMRLRGGGRIQWGIDRCGEQVNGGSRDCRAHSAGGGGGLQPQTFPNCNINECHTRIEKALR